MLMNGHLRPPPPHWSAVPSIARTACHHLDWELVSVEQPDWFEASGQVGAPGLVALWEARNLLHEHGYEVIFDVRVDRWGDALAFGIYGVGVVGRLPSELWPAIAGLLTTCASTITEPRADIDVYALPDLARPASGHTGRHTGRVVPAGHQVGDGPFTWWSYPHLAALTDGCFCAAHGATLPKPVLSTSQILAIPAVDGA
ncbi:hypothetical protein D5S17_35900 [Pseudonocardiaceae bacterium YIM PH 21723]|nr:hypothetical protein D5S17_35900 [Pseudonocardiaceae bacterium YIM PH 21723]